MSDNLIHIEPAGPHRPAFAAWGLAQDPPLQTASASGWDVPISLYPSVPTELLEDAYVDGYLYNRPEPRMTSTPSTPPRGEETPVVFSGVVPVERSARAPRKPRRARKAVTE